MDTDRTTVYLGAGREADLQANGKYVPQRVYTTVPQRSLMHIDSRNRVSGNSFNGTYRLIPETSQARSLHMDKVIFPLLPTINDKNNGITIVHATGTGNTTLTNGYYTVQSLVNEMQAKFTALWQALPAGALNSVSVIYDPSARTVTVTDNDGSLWYLDETSTFNTAGLNVIGFNAGLAFDAISHVSTSLQMIYSRYVIVKSQRLCEDTRIISTTTATSSAMGIVAILDLVEGYDASQFSTGTSFPSTTKVYNLENSACHINVHNRGKAIKDLDLSFYDEFGNNIYNIYNSGFDYDIALWVSLYY
jgi:hypothetical protein